VIRDAPHGTALQQGLETKPISARRESGSNESVSRIRYDASKELAKHLETVRAAGHANILHLSPGAHARADFAHRHFHSSVRHGNTATINHSPVYNVTASSPEAGLRMAKAQGERGAADLVRNIAPMDS
jgi:hypothetical protein